MPLHIHWQEGLFLQPHHLQRMQRSFGEQLAAERRWTHPYPYGVVERALSRDELQNMRLRFDRLRVIMPSGLELHFPENAELPSLDIKQALARSTGGFNVSLGVPLWQSARANTVQVNSSPDSRVKLIYRVGEMECPDENTGENPKALQIRKINARLLLESDDASEMELLPLLRVVRATGDDLGLPKEDPEFAPPCLVVRGSPVLNELIRDLVNAVEASRGELVVQITRGGFSLDTMRGAQFEQVMRLRTLNRFSARLPSLFATSNVTPFALYLELRELLGELAALHPDRDEFACAAYDHDHPYPCFRELSLKIRSFLRGGVLPSFLKVPFTMVNGVLTASLTEAHVSQPNAYYLAIKTGTDPGALARYVQDGDRFKLMPLSLGMRAIRGIELKEDRHVPLELPASADLHYFRLERSASARMWEQVCLEKSAIVRWTGSEINWEDATFTLFMTVPGGTSKP